MNNTFNILQVLRRHFAGAVLCTVVIAEVMSLAGCSKHVTPAAKGDGVLFSAGIGGSESGTKTAYANDHTAGSATAENINWLSGDQIRIWCAECSEPTDHYGDYTVTPESTPTSGKIAVNPGTVGLRWGETGTIHNFYAVYPSPKTTGKSSDAGAFGEGTPKSFTFTGHIPAAQTISGALTTKQTTENSKIITTTIAAPDMTSLYMVSVPRTATPESDGSGVFLNFRPISTAIQFTIENAMTADDARMQVESVKIMSDPKDEDTKGANTPEVYGQDAIGGGKNLAGAFVADVSGTWTKPVISGVPVGSGIISTYQNDYPVCSEPTDKSSQSSALTIDFTGTTACTPGIAKGDRLQFTFFLLPLSGPENVVDDLSFVITRKDGKGTKTIKTRLAMADGTGIPFPVHKKTYVKGILVPDSAQWTIQYTVDVVTPWGDNPEDIPFYYPDVQEITTVTPWTEVECDPGFEKNN